MKQWAVSLIVTGLLLFNHGQVIAESSDDSIIERTYTTWLKATNARDIEAWASYLAPNALFVPPGIRSLTTREAILDYYRKAFADPNFALDCRQLSVEVSQSGEMAWAHGYCQAAFTGTSGHKEHGTSRWFKIWYKQSGGSWKCGVNTWNYQDS